MSNSLSTSAPAVLRSYYRILTGGSDQYDNGKLLRPLLSAHLDFSGSLAGHRPDATDGFLHGVAGFIATVKSIAVIREVHDDNGSAVLYDAEMPGGPVRFAEFFTYRDGVIDTLNLHYDGQAYITNGGH